MTIHTYYLATGLDWAERCDTEAECFKLSGEAEIIYQITEDRSEKPFKITGVDCTEELAINWAHANLQDRWDAIPPLFAGYISDSEISRYSGPEDRDGRF